MGRSMAQMFEAPHVVWHVDYVLSQEARLAQTPAETALLVVDPTQVEAVTALYGSSRFPKVGFCPHAAIGEAAPDDADPEAFEAARPIGLLWSGSLQKPKERPWAHAPEATRRVFDEAFDLALSAEWLPPHRAMDQVLAARGLDLADPAHLGARTSAKWIDIEVRKTRRFEVVKAVAKTGLAIHICGDGWDGDLYRFKRVTCEGPVPMPRVAELMGQARIVLNTNGNFGAGSHERPLSALLAGAMAFSDRTDFYAEALGEDEGIALFRWKALGEGMSKLASLTENPDQAWRIAADGKAKVKAGHTFDHRVDVILSAAGLAVA